MHITRRVATLTSVAALMLTLSTTAALAAAQKAELFNHAGSNCATGQLTSGVPQPGFANINATTDEIIAEIHLTAAPAEAVYSVSVDQTPSTTGCVVPIGTLETNDNGIGNFHAEVPRALGTTDAFVILRPANAAALATGEIDSRDVVFAAH